MKHPVYNLSKLVPGIKSSSSSFLLLKFGIHIFLMIFIVILSSSHVSYCVLVLYSIIYIEIPNEKKYVNSVKNNVVYVLLQLLKFLLFPSLPNLLIFLIKTTTNLSFRLLHNFCC
uniref:Uncharacterized protein n=1 Tax=Cacopsylla melanoneura TaxID=428564 RepID=A0A8D8R133_9HEMI